MVPSRPLAMGLDGEALIALFEERPPRSRQPTQRWHSCQLDVCIVRQLYVSTSPEVHLIPPAPRMYGNGSAEDRERLNADCTLSRPIGSRPGARPRNSALLAGTTVAPDNGRLGVRVAA